MGIEDRDYMRERRRKENSPDVILQRGKPLTLIVIVLVITFIFIVGQYIPEHVSANQARSAQVRPAVVNVNTASLAELVTLPHISETKAQAIIDGRPWSTVDDLIRVYGIGPKTLELIRPYVKVKDEQPQP